jgi:hypothetical protein
MAEEIEHRGFRLEVAEFGAGWRVRIYTPNNKLMLEIPESDRPSGPFAVRFASNSSAKL